MRRLLVLPLALVLLAGCPPPAAPPPSQGGPSGKGGGPADPAGGGTTGGTNGGGGDSTGGGDAAGGGGSADDWSVIPDDVKETIYPTLQPMNRWPSPTGLATLADAPKEQQPPANRVTQLKQLVEAVVHPDLQPGDMDAALGIDKDGHLFMKLGKGKTTGSASMDLAPEGSPFPVFALTIESPGAVGDVAALRAQVAKVVNKDLAKELKVEENQIEAHPKHKDGAQVSGMAMLNRNGFGMQFPYLYAYANKDHLMVVLQEVPHMDSPPEGK